MKDRSVSVKVFTNSAKGREPKVMSIQVSEQPFILRNRARKAKFCPI